MIKMDLRATSYSSVGLEMVLSAVLPYLFGSWLDEKFGTEPYIAVVLLGFGLVTAVRTLYRAVRRMQRDTERDGFEECQTDRNARYAMEHSADPDAKPLLPRRKRKKRRKARRGVGRPSTTDAIR